VAHYGLYCKSLKNLGTEKHRKLLIDAITLKDLGSFAMTELAHGSNVRGVQTTATFCPKTQTFILNTPREEDIKFWIGNLGKNANMSIVYA